MKIKAGQEENYNQFVTVNRAVLMESRIASGG